MAPSSGAAAALDGVGAYPALTTANRKSVHCCEGGRPTVLGYPLGISEMPFGPLLGPCAQYSNAIRGGRLSAFEAISPLFTQKLTLLQS
jgi:hypothetical protein